MDVQAHVIGEVIADRDDMELFGMQLFALDQVEAQLERIALDAPCTLILVGTNATTSELAHRVLEQRANLVVLRVDVISNRIRIARIDMQDQRLQLESLLSALRNLQVHAGAAAADRTAIVSLIAPTRASDALPPADAVAPPQPRPILAAALEWIHAALRTQLPELHGGAGDLRGWTVPVGNICDELDARPPGTAPAVNPAREPAERILADLVHAASPQDEPLVAVMRTLGLDWLEYRVLLLSLASELDIRYQRCIGVLQDDLGMRSGTLGLFASMLGEPADVRCRLASSARLSAWRIFDSHTGMLPPADQPLQLDPSLRGWLLGDAAALNADPALRRVLRRCAWPGASLYAAQAEKTLAHGCVTRLLQSASADDEAAFILFTGNRASWCALLETGASHLGMEPVRFEPARLAGADPVEIEDALMRAARLARLARRPLLFDIGALEASSQGDDLLLHVFGVARLAGVKIGVICAEPARVVRLLGNLPFALMPDSLLPASARLGNVAEAARLLGVGADDERLGAMTRQYPLDVDGFEHAMRLAAARDSQAEPFARFITSCQQVAAEGVSHFADCIDPAFALKDVVLPPEHARQLEEIANNMRMAPKVLDDWRFGEQMPYGRGVAVLFHGPSGTGKTMAALALAGELKTRVLRIDLSRVVSKYIGETEKNLDRIFVDAHRSGATILIDEAEALLGKRSAVKDAHDRYANIEVAYLLQRMETYEGLAIMTTNLRQNLDQAFLRRLRFVMDFPRPDADAREKIWRRCLPAESHALDDATFRHLARKIDLTGGHIRQISLRAAFLAAAQGTRIGLEHLMHAAQAELAKLGMAAVDLQMSIARKAA